MNEDIEQVGAKGILSLLKKPLEPIQVLICFCLMLLCVALSLYISLERSESHQEQEVSTEILNNTNIPAESSTENKFSSQDISSLAFSQSDTREEILRKASLVTSGGDPDVHFVLDEAMQVIYLEKVSTGERSQITGSITMQNPDSTWTVINPNGSVFVVNSAGEAKSKIVQRDNTIPLPVFEYVPTQEVVKVVEAVEVENTNYDESLYFTTKKGERIKKTNLPPAVDYETFEVIFGYSNPYTDEFVPFYTKDKNGVYLASAKKIEGADPVTFKFMNDSISQDKNNTYYEGRIIPVSDRDTFTPLTTNFPDDRYSKDSVHVYYEDTVVYDADVASFRAVRYVCSLYGVDAHHVFDGAVISTKETDPEIFETKIKNKNTICDF